jgi:hypothetical protein
MSWVLGVGGQRRRLGVLGVDTGADGLVFLGDDTVGDERVDEGHLHVAVAEHGGHRLEAHAAVDGLGGEGVAELVGVDVADPGVAGHAFDDAEDHVAVQRAAVVCDEALVADDVSGVGDAPCLELPHPQVPFVCRAGNRA